MKNLTGGIILIILAAVAVWMFWPRREHTPAPPLETPASTKSMHALKVTSSAFADNGMLPSRFTCDAAKPTSPPLTVSGIPVGTKTLALILHDPDAPLAGGFTHWVTFNIVKDIESGILTIAEGKESNGIAGKGSGNTLTYYPPCPPSGTHRYIFTIYALDARLPLREGAAKTELESVMRGHILGKGELISLYARPLRLS